MGYQSGVRFSLNSALVSVRTIEAGNYDWTVIEYPGNLVHMWRYVNISAASGAKTNTISLPNVMKDAEYAVHIAPIFNGHLVKSVWTGSKVGLEGRTKTTVQISMDSTDSENNVGVILFILGYLEAS